MLCVIVEGKLTPKIVDDFLKQTRKLSKTFLSLARVPEKDPLQKAIFEGTQFKIKCTYCNARQLLVCLENLTNFGFHGVGLNYG